MVGCLTQEQQEDDGLLHLGIWRTVKKILVIAGV